MLKSSTMLAFVLCVIAAASSVAAFDPFSNTGAPPPILGAWVGRSYSPDVTTASGGFITPLSSLPFRVLSLAHFQSMRCSDHDVT